MQFHGQEIPQRELATFCERNHIRELSLFGSILNERFRPDSDIDVLIEFEPGRGPGLFGLARMEREISSLFWDRKVDLRTPGDLSRYFRDEVISSASVQYERA